MKRFLIFAALFIGILLATGLKEPIYDDAWMFARYSQNFLSGNGFSWNAIDGPSAGITSPGFLWLVTLLNWLFGAQYNFLLKSLSFIFGSLSSYALYILIFATFTGNDNIIFPKLKSIILLTFLCTLSIVIRIIWFHSSTGMETTTALFVNTFFCILLINTKKVKNNLIYVFLGIISICLRPEYSLFVIFTPILFSVIDERKLFNRKTFKIVLLWTLALIFISFTYLVSFSEILPLPVLSKSSGFFEGYISAKDWNPAVYMGIFFSSLLPFLCVFILGARKTIKSQNLLKFLTLTLIIFVLWIYYFNVVQIMGLNARYYLPCLPFAIISYYYLLDKKGLGFLENSNFKFENILKTFSIVLILFFTTIILPVLEKLSAKLLETSPVNNLYDEKYKKEFCIYNGEDKKGLQFLLEISKNSKNKIIIAASEHGELGAKLFKTTIIDLVGLHDSVIAHEGFDMQYILGRNPDLIYLPPRAYTGLRYKILESKLFKDKYIFYPYITRNGIAVSIESKFRADIENHIQDRSAKLNLSCLNTNVVN